MTATTYSAKVLADSMANGVRLVTFEVTFPRIILAEMNTHRVFSRCSSSSRAIPIEKMIDKAVCDPYIPKKWLSNQRGMQGGEELSITDQINARRQWLSARDKAVDQARKLQDIGVHKQWVNRLLEPFLWHTAIISATEWGNFYFQRIHPEAKPDMYETARAMYFALIESKPTWLEEDEWHLPLITLEEKNSNPEVSIDVWKRISVGRCARVSYLNHLGVRSLADDIILHDKMKLNGHMSPFEHVARPMTSEELFRYRTSAEVPFLGNFRGWVQYRKEIPGEANMIEFLAERKEKDAIEAT